MAEQMLILCDAFDGKGDDFHQRRDYRRRRSAFGCYAVEADVKKS